MRRSIQKAIQAIHTAVSAPVRATGRSAARAAPMGFTCAVAVVAALAFTGPGTAKADETPADADAAVANGASADSVRKLIEITSGVALAEQMFSQLIGALREQHNLPQNLVDELRADTDFNQLLDKTIPIYQKHLTQDDVDAAIGFWSSPAGQRFSSASPQISRESFEIGQTWGRELAERAIARVKAAKLQ